MFRIFILTDFLLINEMLIIYKYILCIHILFLNNLLGRFPKIIVFNWNHFEMRLLYLRINFFIYCGLFVLILVVFLLFLLSLRFGQISPLAFFRRFTATSDRNAESCNRIPSNYCLPEVYLVKNVVR